MTNINTVKIEKINLGEPLTSVFQRLDIQADTYSHPATFTVAESADWAHLIPGGHCKNLFLKDKKDRQYLVTALADTQIDLKALTVHLNAGRLSFGSAERLMRALGVTPGSVTPLALMNNVARDVTPILDKRLFEQDLINCHPLRNDMTTVFAPQALTVFMKDQGYDAMVIDFAAIGPIL